MKLYIRLSEKKKKKQLLITQSSQTWQLNPIQILQGKKKKLRPEFNSLFQDLFQGNTTSTTAKPIAFQSRASHFQQVLLLPKKGEKVYVVFQQGRNVNANQVSTQSRREVQPHPKSHSRPHIFSHMCFHRLHMKTEKTVSNCVSLELYSMPCWGGFQTAFPALIVFKSSNLFFAIDEYAVVSSLHAGVHSTDLNSLNWSPSKVYGINKQWEVLCCLQSSLVNYLIRTYIEIAWRYLQSKVVWIQQCLGRIRTVGTWCYLVKNSATVVEDTRRKGGRRTRDERSAAVGACAVHWRWDEVSGSAENGTEFSGMEAKNEDFSWCSGWQS